jgi:hypothetical protein
MMDNSYIPAIGDRVQVFMEEPVRGTVVNEFVISAEDAERLRKYYPDLRAGDKGYGIDTGGGDTRNVMASDMKFISRAPKR